MSKIKVFINYNDARWRGFKVDFQKIADMAADRAHTGAEVSIVLTNDAEIQKMNHQYRSINKPTNVLSFETGDDVLLGDIFISIDTVLKEARSENKKPEDHIAHMLVHGILHLTGYDHINDKDANKMENMEIKILKKLGIANPYEEDLSISWFDKTIKSKWMYFITFGLGLIASFGFAPFNFWPLTVAAIGVIYLIACNKNVSVWKLLPFGAGYAAAMFWWVLNSIFVVPELAMQFAIWTVPGIIGIAIGGLLVFNVPLIIINRIQLNAGSRAIVFACAWTLVLWFREWLLTGFPWNPIANLSMPYPIVSNSMSLWGALGLTFVIIGLTASIAQFIKNKKNFISLAVFSVLFLFGTIYGHINILNSISKSQSSVIRIVQPAKSAAEKATHSRAEAIKNAERNIQNLIDLTKSKEGNYDLVVFPETTYPFLVADNNLSFVAKIAKPTVVGATSYDAGNFYNSLIISNADGKIEKIYSKTHLVPFGEYRPLGDWIPTPGQLTRGNGPEVLTIGDLKFAPAVCYEIVFTDSLINRSGNDSVNAIINITNDTWFGKTPGTYQHLDMVRRYAIESGLPIIRSNYSGISAFVMPNGYVSSQLPIGTAGVLDGTVSGAHVTPYRKIGRDMWMVIILLFSTICVISINGFRKKD